jgi:hypothetical protein
MQSRRLEGSTRSLRPQIFSRLLAAVVDDVEGDLAPGSLAARKR